VEENTMSRKFAPVVLVIASTLVLIAIVIGLPAAGAQETGATVQLGGNADLGPFLVDAQGMTLYIFANDTPGVSNCSGDCLANWPPLLVAEGQQPTLAAGIPGRLGVIQRPDDATFQVVFNGMPLYYWVNDAQPGDATGHNVGDVWFVARPADVSLGGNAELGPFLVGPNGMTLYLFTKDTPGVSNCSGDCLANWPPLLVAEGQQPTLQPGLAGTLGTIAREDGTFQVTFNDMPLYYWVNDAQPGDATGQNVGEVWFVIQPPTVSVGGNDELGLFLVGPDGMTLYLYTKDTPGVSNCYDECAVRWPPLLVPEGQQPTAGEGVTGSLGITERQDGTYQVTYNDMPLYYWIRDVVPGDATGQNVGEVWFVVPPESAGAASMGEESMAAALDGAALVAERCTVCHTRERIDNAQKDRAGWEATVDRMIGNGAKLTPEEREAVIEFLSSR
jgi:predicted lipoprotein with Yx(FWY)xxD motif